MGKVAIAVLAVVAILGAWFFIDIDQTQEARAPDVDIEVTGGQLPEYDVETGDVEVGTTEITVPTIDLQSPEEDKAEGNG